MENQTTNQSQQINQPQYQQPMQPPFPQAPTPAPKKPWYKKWWVWVIVGVLVIGAIGSQINKEPESKATTSSSVSKDVNSDKQGKNDKDTKEEEKKEDKAEVKETEAPEEDPEAVKADFIKSCTAVDYKTLSRNPDKYKGEHYTFTGQVIQVLDSDSIFNNSTTLRINVTPEENQFADGGYLWTDTILCTVTIPEGADRILKDDIIDIYGVCEGLYTYETILGDNQSLPLIDIKYYDIHD